MNMRALEKTKHQLQFAADSMPQLICLVDRDGRVIRANRTVERWNLGRVESVGGLHLHDLLHKRCSDSACYLRLFGQQNACELAKDRRAECDAWDPILERHFVIRTQLPVRTPEQEASSEDFFAIVTVDDVTELRANMTNWISTEEALRVSNIQLQRLKAQHLTIQESERQRIAADLHDGLGQSLSLLKLSVESAAKSVRAGDAVEAVKVLEQLARKVRSVLDELRGIAMNLRPSIIDDLGIRATLAWFFREFEASGVKTRIERDIDVNESDVPQPLKIVIFRILQEAVNNAVKHAHPDRIKVNLGIGNAGETLEFSIEDDGKGFDPADLARPVVVAKGLGLQSMRERAELSGAHFDLESARGMGTRIRVRWPSVKALERNIVALPPRTLRVIRNVASLDPKHPQYVAASTPSEIENFLFCAACLRTRGPAATSD